MRFGGFCVIFVVFVNFVCFNGSVVAFVIFLLRWYCALVVVCLFFDLFCGLCLCPCGVVGCVFVFCGVCFPVCICVMNCGGPVWADLWCVYYMWFWLWFRWLAKSGRLYAFDLVEFVYYNFIIIYCYLCYK